MKTENRFGIRKSLFSFCIIALGFVFLIWRVRYGYCFNDEPFVLTLAHRLVRGEKLIMDEWNAAQLFGIVLYPIFNIFYTLNGSTEGILLFSRGCFCIIWFITGICVFAECRMYSRYAIAAFIYFILFAPLDYMTCSYTSFGLIGVLMLGCLFLKTERKVNKHNGILTGMASSVLCCIIVLCSPFFSIVYVAGLVILLVAVRQRGGTNRKYHNTIIFSNLICTVMLGAVCFYVFSLKGHSFSDLMIRLPYIFIDPVHNDTFIQKAIQTVKSIYRPMLVLYLIGIALLLFFMLSTKWKKYRSMIALYWAAIFVFSRIAIASIVIDHFSFNYEMLDMGIFGFAAFILLKNKPWKLFFGFSCVGLLYTICTFAASNTKLMSLSASFVPCGVAGIIYIILLAQEIREDNSGEMNASAAVVICMILLCQFSLQICVRTSRQYWDAPLSYLTETIHYGAAKGLITTPEQCEEYEENYLALSALLSEVDCTSEKRFLNLSSNPVIYLDADMSYGTFSSWTFGYYDSLGNRLQQYFNVVPENIPELIYYTDEEENLTQFFELASYHKYDYFDHHLLVRER